jgi:hypothetical protein
MYVKVSIKKIDATEPKGDRRTECYASVTLNAHVRTITLTDFIINQPWNTFLIVSPILQPHQEILICQGKNYWRPGDDFKPVFDQTLFDLPHLFLHGDSQFSPRLQKISPKKEKFGIFVLLPRIYTPWNWTS